MVAVPDGTLRAVRSRARARVVAVGRRRCAVAADTPLAALLATRIPRVRLRDYGACSRRSRDAGGLFVTAIGRHGNRGNDGWVYKVGTRQGTAGAADPGGPLGRGRLRSGARVTWFYCRFDERAGSCQRTLATRSDVGPDGEVVVRVTAHDDRGRAAPAGGAAVSAGGASTVADAGGVARLRLPPGEHEVRAARAGLIPSYPGRVTVR